MRKVKVSRPAARRRRKRPRAAKARGVEAALAALAHEIRTPLTGILALSELIATADLPERERQWAAAVKSAAQHLAHLTALVIDGVRAQARGVTLRREPFRPRALAEALAMALRARAQAKGLDCDVAIAGDLPELVIGDAVRLRAALENLIDNAVKFTERGHVALTVGAAPARKRHRLVFAVADSGIGLTRLELARLFRPFAQASAAVGRRFGGSGLGLAFARRMAKAMGGNLKVASRPGRGSTFRFEVSVEPVSEAKPPPARGMPPVAAPRRLRVLCAEDNPYARVVLNTILTELGHTVEFVGSGASAVDRVGKGGFDAVLMDVTLPDMDGLEATRRIRALGGAAARVPVIGISGRSEPSAVQAARNAGMNAYLAKPVSPAALAQTLAESLRGSDVR
jgi:two-component system, sensor histidine kinase